MRDQLPQARPRLDSHAGLLLQRYVVHAADGTEPWSRAKRDILEAARTAATCELYKAAFERWRQSLPELTATDELRTAGRLIVGLGSENVLETGIRLHHTYGIPILPGSALKGLAAHYCDQVWGPTEPQFKLDRPFHTLLFGATDAGGVITFHDAWLVPDSEKEPLKLDVMTPHHPKWNDISNPVAPTDFDSPTPVPFLSVMGTFRVAVSWHGPEHKEAKSWTGRAKELLCDALKDWGIGGKTTSGYGRLTLPPPPPPPRKRNSNEKARVKLIATRPKGFDVQDVELGRAPGTLTVGTPPPETDTNLGAIVDVLVLDDKPQQPQYKWPQPPKK